MGSPNHQFKMERNGIDGPTLFEEYFGYPDPRTSKYPFMGSPVPTILLVTIYFCFVKYWGPAYMQNRKPMRLNFILIPFNAFLVIANAFSFYVGITHNYNFNFVCEPMNWTEEFEQWALPIGFCFLGLKYIELLDTVFFVLRKKQHLVTNLHLIHHITVPVVGWALFKYYPGGSAIFGVILNAFIHCIMYFYYLLATLGPNYRKYLWWKKYLTILQMMQFIVDILQGTPALLGYCEVPKIFRMLCMFFGPLFLILFANFYVHSYVKKRT